MKIHLGRWANFTEEETKRIKSAYKKLKEVSTETRHDNRDTQILHRIVERLNWIVEQQYKEEDD